MAGTVGAIFNGALSFGSAIGLAVVSSIETSVEATHGGSQGYTGLAAAFWFLFGIVALEAISISIFYDRSTDHKPQPQNRSCLSDITLNSTNVTMALVN
jgi:hypothetical protein